MDFDSPEVMKDFPGLYMPEKRKGTEGDYNDDNERASKKEMIIGKRKEKKDKKDKDKGYAALEGESSDEASSSKSKKSKTFKFTKSKDKEKELRKTEAQSKKKAKFGGFGNKPTGNINQDLAEALPIFGVDLSSACQRAKCHDGINLPLPIRQCVDYIESCHFDFEHIYKITAPKAKVHHIKKMYNRREPVRFEDLDIPTATGVIKAFIRELPEVIFTNDLLIRFEEAGAVLNHNTRAKHLSSLISSLPDENQLLLMYLLIHFDRAIGHETTKMNLNHMAQALSSCFKCSPRLIQVLIDHSPEFFPETVIGPYCPPLDAGSSYPDDPELILLELQKLESAINLIHWEMQQGVCTDSRQDALWENQRIQTDLKRKLKKALAQQNQTTQKETADPTTFAGPSAEAQEPNVAEEDDEPDENESEPSFQNVEAEIVKPDVMIKQEVDHSNEYSSVNAAYYESAVELVNHATPISATTQVTIRKPAPPIQEQIDPVSEPVDDIEYVTNCLYQDQRLIILQAKNACLMRLMESLSENIRKEKEELEEYKKRLLNASPSHFKVKLRNMPKNFEEVLHLLAKENHMLEITKVQLVRQITEYREQCANLEAQIILLNSKSNLN